MNALGAGGALTAGVVFFWLGMVAAISFIEAPLKFQAPGVTVQLGLGIGRLVFRVLNRVELVLAATLAVTVALHPPAPRVLAGIVVAITVLGTQLAGVRPFLTRRSDAVLAAADSPPGGMAQRSHAHYAYAGLELVKATALLAAGVTLLAAA